MSCILFPIAVVVGYFIINSIINVMNRSSNQLEQLVCLGVVFVLILGFKNIAQDKDDLTAKKKKWAKACSVDRVNIVERSGGTWDDGHRYHTSWWLKLEMNSDQIAACPHQTIVSVKVSQSNYYRLEQKSSVRIYYMPETPFEFLLENEIYY